MFKTYEVNTYGGGPSRSSVCIFALSIYILFDTVVLQ